MLQERLVELGLDWVNNYYPYINPVPYNTIALEKMIVKHIKAGNKIAIFPDSDVDGILSALEMKSLIELMGCKNVYIVSMEHKSHGLNNKFIDQVINSDAKLLITVDSTTNNSGSINKLSVFGIDHIIIDHHEITEDIDSYPSNVVVVNSRDSRNEGFNNVSAGMLCYIIAHNLLNKVKIGNSVKESFLNKMFIFGYITLYTDCMDLLDKYNLSVIKNIYDKVNLIPKVISQFMGEYDSLCRNFIEFKFGPRINALIRNEKFNILYELMFCRLNDERRALLLELTENCYQNSKELVGILSTKIPVIIEGHYVFGNLDLISVEGVNESIIKNYTGLIANNLANTYKKLAIVVSSDGFAEYKGSVRDLYSRKSLKLFERFCDCGGHMSAFGFRLLKRDIRNFNNQLNGYRDVMLNAVKTSQIVLDGDRFDDRLPYFLHGIAEYNEISGNTMPKAVIRKRIGHSMKVRRYEKYSSVMWDDVKIVCFQNVYIGDTLEVLPTIGKNEVVCYGTVRFD